VLIDTKVGQGKPQAEYPDFSGNACVGFSDDQRRKLWEAAYRLAISRGIMMKFIDLVGTGTDWAKAQINRAGESAFGDKWEDLQSRIQGIVEDILWQSYNGAYSRSGPSE
jgi:hypothetical protein